MEQTTTSQVSFEAPGKGSWELEGGHIQRPTTRFTQELIRSALPLGFSEGTARYGLMLDHLRVEAVNGFMYAQPVPFGAPAGATGNPPKLLIQLLTRLHPGIRRRLRTSKQAFENKLWREDLRRWDEEVKPACIRAHRTLQAMDPATLSRDELVKHLEACRNHLHEMIRLHHVFSMAAGMPVADFLVHAQEWTGKSTGDLARLLKGSSPLSGQFATAEFQNLLQALRTDPEARELLASRAPARELLDGLLARPGAAGEQMRAYVETVGFRSLGYDLAEPYVLEVPDALVRALRAAVEEESRGDGAADPRHLEQVREAVPERHRPQFDELLAEARLVYRLRDERATYCDGWALGLARRAVLAVGARLREEGRLPEAELAVDAGHDELAGLLRGTSTPTAEELQRRAHWRKTRTFADAPAWLGAPPSPPPPTEWLPEEGRRANRAVMFYMEGVFGEATAPATETSVQGLPVSPGIYEGTARIVKEQADLGRILKGDVLVAPTTSPYFNVVLPLLGAVVTDRGGQLCHAAIVTREYGIPGIVGTREATKVVRDGARVRVNGTTGELKVLS